MSTIKLTNSKIIKPTRAERISIFFLSTIQFIALTLELSPDKIFRPFSIMEIPLFVFLMILTKFVIKSTKRDQVLPAAILGALFSFFIYGGHSMEKFGDLSEISFTSDSWIKSIIIIAGYTLFFFMCIRIIFILFDHSDFKNFFISEKNKSGNIIYGLLTKRPMLTSFLLMTILTLPNIIISYPGVMTGDSYYQLQQGFGLENKRPGAYFAPTKPELYKTIDGERVLINTKLTNYHPIAHTMLIHWCMDLGNLLFSSDNAGLFFLVILQNFLMNFTLAYCVGFFITHLKINPTVCLLFLAYYILHPSIRTQMVTVSKEGMYIPFLILFIVEIAKTITIGVKSGKFNVLLIIVSIVGVILFRNEGKFLVGFSLFLFFLFNHGKRTLFFFCLCFSVVLSGFYELIILPHFNVAPGNIREMLSAPFQQTARYIRDAEQMITDQEKKHIEAVLEYNEIKERYKPESSDPVKNAYKSSATISDLKRYAFTWFHMLLKRPDIYILATMNNYFRYFYPTDAEPNYFTFGFGGGEMWLANRDCSEINLDLHFPASLSKLRSAYESMRNFIFSLPLLRCVWVSAFYIWAFLLCETFSIVKKNRNATMLGIPMIIQILIYITGPYNGSYSRYIFILKACLPLIFITSLSIIFRSEPLAKPK